MDLQIALLLAQDGVITGAIYALLAVAILLVFTVTRVIFVPQGEFVAFSALTMAALQNGKTPGTLWLLLAMSGIAAAMELRAGWRERDRARMVKGVALYGALPVALTAIVAWLVPLGMPLLVQALVTNSRVQLTLIL